jgi:putative ABC transport system ATP-binding protein
VTFGAPRSGLVAHSIRVTYGSDVALDDVSVSLHSSEVTVLLGASGSGKSTLLHVMSGLQRPVSGEVRWQGVSIFELSLDERTAIRRENFGYVFQFGELVPELTLRENIALPLELLRIQRRVIRERVSQLVASLGIEDHADRRASQVSGGQAQRAAVGRAIAHRPKVVFADEPTGALDSANAERVLSLLLGLAREHAATVVLVTHERSLAEQGDRVIELRDGQIVHDDVLNVTPGQC